MDVLPLPPRPDLAQYRKRAKELVRASTSPDSDAVRRWAAAWLEALARLSGATLTPFVQESIDRAVGAIEHHVRARRDGRAAPLPLADAQFVIARAHGFESWPVFARHVEGIARSDPAVRDFESAADAIVAGDHAALEALLRATPALILTRSARSHRATLLHYVAANGVEDFRQKSPPNAVAIARVLLAAGAEPDALAETYGGGSAQTTMNLLVSSEHPARAGVQEALVETLLDSGAAVDGVDDDGSPLMTALAFGYAGAADTLVARGARVDNVIAAAALGDVERVKSMVAEGGGLGPGARLVATRWPQLRKDPKAHVALAFVWACKFGRTRVVELLLAKGVDPAVADDDAMTGLHLAAAFGHVELIPLLVEHGAPLEARNRWGGTVLDSTVYFAIHGPVPGVDYLPVIERLIEAGADIGAVTPPTGNEAIDALLRR